MEKGEIHVAVSLQPTTTSEVSEANSRIPWDRHFVKTEFYHGSSALVNGKVVYNLFSEIDPQQHARERKPISKYYSMSSIFPLEPHMDNVLNQLCQQLETRFIDGQNVGKPANIGEWLLFYSWDAVGAVTFSQPIGYLANGHDFDKTLTNSEKAMDYFSVVGTMPFLDYVFDKNPVVRLGPPGFGTITTISLRHLVDRYQGNDKDYHDPSKPDFLDRFIEVKNANPDTVNDPQIISWLMINMIAGADTTAITIRSALYYSLRTPGVWTRLRSELAAAGLTKDRCPIQYRDCRSVAYLDAIVREALRILPGVSLSLERYVPASGCHLPDGSFLPGGTIVGLNPYLLARNREVWGDDAESFRPERWFRGAGEGEEAFQARLRAMNDADLSFGGGRRICIGKNMGLIQVFKVVATLVTLYDMELVDPEKEWKVTNSWFPRQEGLEVKLSKREW